MDTRGIDQMLSGCGPPRRWPRAIRPGPGRGGGADFGEVLQVGHRPGEFGPDAGQEMAKGFSAGDPNVNLQDVMVNLQRPTCLSSRWCRCATSWSRPTRTS